MLDLSILRASKKKERKERKERGRVEGKGGGKGCTVKGGGGERGT